MNYKFQVLYRKCVCLMQCSVTKSQDANQELNLLSDCLFVRQFVANCEADYCLFCAINFHCLHSRFSFKIFYKPKQFRFQCG